jgi:hypothetical protein
LEVGSWKLEVGSCALEVAIAMPALFFYVYITGVAFRFWKLVAGSLPLWTLLVRGCGLEGGSWKLEGGGWFEVAGWKVEVGSWKSVGSDVSRISYTVCLPEFAGIGRASDMLELCDPVVYELLGLLAPT